MARLTHNPTRPDSTFRPLEISTAEITRMREETARIVDNMERNRRAELEQGMANLKAMRENAEYQQRQQQRNFEIEQQNLKAERLEKQLEAQTAQNQAKANREAAQQIFGSLAGLSQTAAKATAEIKVENEKRDFYASYISAAVNPDYVKETWYKDNEIKLLQSGEIYSSTIAQQEALGADPLSSAKARISNPALTHFSNKGNATFILSNQYSLALEAVLNSGITVPYKGQTVDISQARRNPELMGIAGTFALRTLLQKANLVGLDDQFLMPGLKEANQYLLSQQAQASKLQREDINLQNEELILNTIRNNVDGLATYGPTGFRQLAALPHLGYAGALDKFESFAIERDQDGNFRYSMEELKGLDVRGNGRTFAEEWPNRWTSMQEARVKSQIEYDRREFAVDDIAYQKDVDRTMELLSGENNTEANTREVIQYFRDTHPGKPIPSALTQNLNSFTIEAKEKIEAVKQLRAIPYGFVQAEDVLAAQKYGQEIYREIASRYEEQNKIWKSDLAKDLDSGFKTLANGVNSLGSQKANTNSSGIFLFALRAEFKNRVTQSIKRGEDPTAAMIKHSADITKEASEGVRIPGNKWYRDISKPGGMPQYPGLTQGPLNAIIQAQRKREELATGLKEKGTEGLLNTKGAVLSAEAAAAVVQNWNKPGFKLPPEITMLTALTKLDPFVALNSVIRTETGQELPLPPSLSSVSQTVSPAFRNLLYQTPSPERSTRGLGSTNMFNPAIVPNNMGQLYVELSQEVGVAPGIAAALFETESQHDPNAVSPNGKDKGIGQINEDAHADFIRNNNWRDPRVNGKYALSYYKPQLDKYGDPVAAYMAYNAGPGNYEAYLRGELDPGTKAAMLRNAKRFAAAYYKYGGGRLSLNNQALMRPGSPIQQTYVTQARDDTARSVGSDFVIKNGLRGARYLFPVQGKVLKVVRNRNEEYHLEKGDTRRGYGNNVEIRVQTPYGPADFLFAHFDQIGDLQVGQTVPAGTFMGTQGRSGSTTGAHISVDAFKPGSFEPDRRARDWFLKTYLQQ